MLKKARVPFCCVPLQKPGHVRTGHHTVRKVSLVKVTIICNNLQYLMCPYPSFFTLQRRWPTAGSTMSSQSSCTRIGDALSPRRRGTCTSPKWKLRTQETTPALFPAPSSGRVSSPSSSPSSPYHLMKVSREGKTYFWKHILFVICDVWIFTFFMTSGERKYPADIRVKFPDTTAMLASNITLECFALGK